MIKQVDFPPRSHIEIRDGQARITGRNVKVKMVVSRLLHGEKTTIEEFMEQYDLTRAEVLACLAYYYQDAIEQHFEQQEQAVHQNAIALDELIEWLKQKK